MRLTSRLTRHQFRRNGLNHLVTCYDGEPSYHLVHGQTLCGKTVHPGSGGWGYGPRDCPGCFSQGAPAERRVAEPHRIRASVRDWIGTARVATSRAHGALLFVASLPAGVDPDESDHAALLKEAESYLAQALREVQAVNDVFDSAVNV